MVSASFRRGSRPVDDDLHPLLAELLSATSRSRDQLVLGGDDEPLAKWISNVCRAGVVGWSTSAATIRVSRQVATARRSTKRRTSTAWMRGVMLLAQCDARCGVARPARVRFDRVSRDAGADAVTFASAIGGSVPLDRLPEQTTRRAVSELSPTEPTRSPCFIRVPQHLAVLSAAYRAFLALLRGRAPERDGSTCWRASLTVPDLLGEFSCLLPVLCAAVPAWNRS